MWREGLRSFGLMAATSASLCAGWKITAVTTSADGQRQIETEYLQGDLRRSDVRTGTRETVSVIDLKRHRQVMWDVGSRQYVVHRLQSRPRATTVSSNTIVVDVETKDTGERRAMLGRTARHVITHERRHWESGGALETSELQTDGWYVDSDSLPRYKRGGAVAVLTLASYGAPQIKVNRKGPTENGLPVWKKMISMSLTPQGQRNTIDSTVEVTELNEGQLDAELFAPPLGFERVLQFPSDYALPWDQQMRLRWEWFQDWLAQLF